ncbi:MAG: hypothetical protein WC386_02170 [Candidatus Paceibacterota bacterium]|jgi:uncharacterized membrane protein YagU involved in acid resistance
MWKRVLSLVILVSFFSVSFCFAFDANTIKDEWLPKIVEWWNMLLGWVNNTAIPWIETNISAESRQEFQKEFTEALSDVPVAIQNCWNYIKGLFD